MTGHLLDLVPRPGRTGVPGVWAAGNAIDPHAQVIAAADASPAAAIDINTTASKTTPARPPTTSPAATR